MLTGTLSVETRLEPQFSLEVPGFGPGDLEVVRFRGVEAISEPFHFRLDLVSRHPDLDLAALADRPTATLVLRGQDGDRRVPGILDRFTQVGRGRSRTHYRARLVSSRLSTLALDHGSQSFLHQSVPEIVQTKLWTTERRAILRRPHPVREFCLRYQETSLAFVSRLMEDEGIFYYFEAGGDHEALVLGDDPSAHLFIPGDPNLPFHDAEGDAPPWESVSRFAYGHRRTFDGFEFTDYEFRRPSLDLHVRRGGHEQVYSEYPAGYRDRATGEERGRVREEEFRARAEGGVGWSDSPRLLPGHRFVLENHPREEFNREYLVIRVAHRGRQPRAAEPGAPTLANRATYENRFTCIPASVPFRPRRRTPKPRMTGPQTAVVVDGELGEEGISTDAFGRVRVRFHWDVSLQNPFVRVGQMIAGAGWGSLFLPRLGQEVIVHFLHGDPDQPIITGCVYNGNNPPPYALPDECTRSTIKTASTPGEDGGNELRFEDAAGSEEIYLHAQRAFLEVIRGSSQSRIGGGRNVEVARGEDTLTVQSGNRRVEVPSGEYTVGANRAAFLLRDEFSAAASHLDLSGRTCKVDAPEEILLQAGASSIKLTRDEIFLKSGPSEIWLGPAGITIRGAKIYIN